eukprot:gene25684-11349_t
MQPPLCAVISHGIASESESESETESETESKTESESESDNAAATMSRFITRRFGIVGGLVFVAVLASSEGYEIVKALLETEEEGDGVLVELPSGLGYRELKDGETVVLDTKANNKAIAFTFGKKPYGSVVCEGLVEGIMTMKRGGVRELTVPPQLAFGDKGRVLNPENKILPGATLTYVLNKVLSTINTL